MTAVEITLIIIGIIFVIGSFFVKDKLLPKDLEQISMLSEAELRIVVEKQLENAHEEVEASIVGMVEEAQEVTKRGLEKVTNEKIIAIDEFSNTVLNSIGKSHEEIMFLYSMLNDKHATLTELASSLQQLIENLKSAEREATEHIAEVAHEMHEREEQPVEEMESENLTAEEDVDEEPVVDMGNHNEAILALHSRGMSDVEIARQLGLGQGEVKLVIGLFRGETAGEV